MGMSARRKKLFSTDKQRYAPQSNDMHRKSGGGHPHDSAFYKYPVK
jgi:hypothetical protein